MEHWMYVSFLYSWRRSQEWIFSPTCVKSLVGVWYDLDLSFLGPGNPAQGALPEDDLFSLKGKSLALAQQNSRFLCYKVEWCWCSHRRRWAHIFILCHFEPASRSGMRKDLLWPQVFWRQFFNAFTLVLTPCPNPFLLWGWIPHWLSSESPLGGPAFVSGDLSSTFHSISPISRSSGKFSCFPVLFFLDYIFCHFRRPWGGRIRHVHDLPF